MLRLQYVRNSYCQLPPFFFLISWVQRRVAQLKSTYFLFVTTFLKLQLLCLSNTSVKLTMHNVVLSPLSVQNVCTDKVNQHSSLITFMNITFKKYIFSQLFSTVELRNRWNICSHYISCMYNNIYNSGWTLTAYSTSILQPMYDNPKQKWACLYDKEI